MKSIIEFQNSVFREGVNITVRKGTKWINKNPSNIIVLDKYIKKFNKLTTTELQLLHDSELSNYFKLLKEMKKYYLKFTENSVITVIWFILDK